MLWRLRISPICFGFPLFLYTIGFHLSYPFGAMDWINYFFLYFIIVNKVYVNNKDGEVFNWIIFLSDNLNNKIVNETKWPTISEVLAKLVAPISSIVLARLSTPKAFGVVAKTQAGWISPD